MRCVTLALTLVAASLVAPSPAVAQEAAATTESAKILGNWLVDPSWNLILVDDSRALTGDKKLVHKLNRVDAVLWEKMQALTEDQLKAALGQWLGGREIRAILDRRTKMAEEIAQLVKANGAEKVFFR
jgi:hypothetical protein